MNHRSRRLATLGLFVLSLGAGKDAPDKNLALHARLDEPLALTFKNAPLQDVFSLITSADGGPKSTGILIHVDRDGLKAAGVTLQTPVTIDSGKDALRTSLSKLLNPLGLTYRVRDGLLEVTAYVTPPPRVPSPEPVQHDPRNKAILAAIEAPRELHFKDTRLEDVLKSIKNAGAGPENPDIPIHVDPIGLLEAGVTLKSPVTFSAKNEPLGTSMARLLKPLGLTYTVKNGLLTITSLESVDE